MEFFLALNKTSLQYEWYVKVLERKWYIYKPKPIKSKA